MLVLRREAVYSTSSAMSAGEGGSSERRRGRPGVRVVGVRAEAMRLVSCWEGEAIGSELSLWELC